MGRIADITRHLALPEQQRRQIVALDQELESCQAQMKVLQAENLKLRAEINPLKQEVERLKKQVEQKPAAGHVLEQTEIDMLKFIGNKRSVTSADVQSGMQLHSVPAEHFLGRLLKSGYLEQVQVPLLGVMYSLSDKGNAYLMDKKLVPLTTGKVEQPSNPSNYPCDHCGSTRLKRTGTRPNPNFGEVGIKDAIFVCLDCGKESAIEQPAPH